MSHCLHLVPLLWRMPFAGTAVFRSASIGLDQMPCFVPLLPHLSGPSHVLHHCQALSTPEFIINTLVNLQVLLTKGLIKFFSDDKLLVNLIIAYLNHAGTLRCRVANTSSSYFNHKIHLISDIIVL